MSLNGAAAEVQYSLALDGAPTGLFTPPDIPDPLPSLSQFSRVSLDIWAPFFPTLSGIEGQITCLQKVDAGSPNASSNTCGVAPLKITGPASPLSWNLLYTGQNTNIVFNASGGKPPYFWSFSRDLPAGLTLVSTGSSLAIMGKPRTPDPILPFVQTPFSLPNQLIVTVHDSANQTATTFYSFSIVGPVFNPFFVSNDKVSFGFTSLINAIAVAALYETPCPAIPICDSAIQNFLGVCIGSALAALDPPDSDFTVLPKPDLSPPLRFGAVSGLSREQVTALNQLFKNMDIESALWLAIGTSVNRAQGASLAQAQDWEDIQLSTAKKYAGLLAAYIGARSSPECYFGPASCLTIRKHFGV